LPAGGQVCCCAASKTHEQAGLKRAVLSVKSGQLSFVVFQFVKQSSVLLARAFSQTTRSLLVEQALLSLEAKLVQPASPCNPLQVPKKLPEWLLLFDYLT